MPEEGEPNWFSRWDEDLPTPEELMPLSQTLITPHLALAFDIPTTPSSLAAAAATTHAQPPPQPSAAALPLQTHLPLHQDNHLPPPSGSYDSPELATAAGGGGSADEPARTLKRPRLVWTPQLHKRFVDAVAHLGIKNAVPKTIMQLMNVDGLTRENVASHLQKYRLYLKRMQGLSSAGAGGGGGGPVSSAEEHLFASAPVPHQFLSRGPPPAAVPRSGGSDQFVPFAQVAALQQHQHQMVAAAAAHQQQPQFHHHRHMGYHMGSTPGGGFEHGYITRQQQQQQQAGIQRVVGQGGAVMVNPTLTGSYGEDMDVGAGAEVGRRKVLTLFPTGDD